MRTPIIAGNWKMFKTLPEAQALAREIVAGTHKGEVEIVLIPPYPFLSSVADLISGSGIELGAQEMHVIAGDNEKLEHFGARTGMVSAPMLKSVGCRYVLVGHSERRQYFGETDHQVGLKVRAALDCGLDPILCLGESLEEREAQQTLSRVATQLQKGLRLVPQNEMTRVVVAYEPVWAIGTGKVATPAMAQEVHAHIRKEIAALYCAMTAQTVRIQYGGSVTPDNAPELLAETDVDGALVGGASLKPESFSGIVAFNER